MYYLELVQSDALFELTPFWEQILDTRLPARWLIADFPFAQFHPDSVAANLHTNRKTPSGRRRRKLSASTHIGRIFRIHQPGSYAPSMTALRGAKWFINERQSHHHHHVIIILNMYRPDARAAETYRQRRLAKSSTRARAYPEFAPRLDVRFLSHTTLLRILYFYHTSNENTETSRCEMGNTPHPMEHSCRSGAKWVARTNKCIHVVVPRVNQWQRLWQIRLPLFTPCFRMEARPRA